MFFSICEITLENKTKFFGSGDGFSRKISKIKAFSEAWERMWVSNSDSTSSNGFAAGPSLEISRTNALHELIDRQLVLVAWQNKNGWEPYTPQGIYTALVTQILAWRGWRLTWYQIKSANSHSTLTALARHSQLGAHFDSTYFDPRVPLSQLEAKLVQSLGRAIQFCPETPADWSFPTVGEPQDQSHFYRNSSNLIAFDFLPLMDDKTKPELIQLPDFEQIQFTTLFSSSSFPFVSRAHHSNWINLEWGRQSIRGCNSFPHPIA